VKRLATAAALAVALWAGAGRARAESPRAESPPVRAPAAAAAGVVNLNDASEEELSRLPGIGPGKARAIAEHRHAHPFHRADELTKVKGIGRKTFGRLRPYITTVGPTTLKEEVKLHR
jgi:competence protein ComEA